MKQDKQSRHMQTYFFKNQWDVYRSLSPRHHFAFNQWDMNRSLTPRHTFNQWDVYRSLYPRHHSINGTCTGHSLHVIIIHGCSEIIYTSYRASPAWRVLYVACRVPSLLSGSNIYPITGRCSRGLWVGVQGTMDDIAEGQFDRCSAQSSGCYAVSSPHHPGGEFIGRSPG